MVSSNICVNANNVESMIDQSDSKSVPSSTVPFRRDPDFVDRGTLLNEVNRKCVVSGSRTALFGLGGIG
jgi:hypothetical protein